MGKTLADGYLELRVDPSKLDADTKKAFKAIGFKQRAAAAGKESGDGFAKGFADRSSVFAKVIATTAARFTLLGGAAAAAAPGVLHLTAALAPAAGTLIALPAAMAAVKVASGTLKLAVAGVGDAITAGLTGTAKQAEKALKELPAPARDFAKQIIALKPQLDGLRTSVSGRFFAPLSDEIKPLASAYLPMLGIQMPALAESLGRVGEQALRAAKRATVFSGIRSLFTNTREGIDGASKAVGSLVEGFGALLRVGSPLLQRLGESAGTVGERFGRFLVAAERSGQLRNALQGGINTLKDLGAIAGNVGSILRSVFSAATTGGSTLLTNLKELTGQAANFLKAAQGQSALASLFGTLGQLGQTLRSALGAVLPAIAQSIQVLAPAVSGLAPAFGQIVIAVAPLLPYLTQIAATILTKVTPAISALAGWLTEHQQVLKVVVGTIGGFIAAQKAAAAVTAVQSAILAVQGAGGLVAYLRGTMLVRAATAAWTGVQWLLNTALSANPIGIVIAIIVALVAAIVIAYKNSETFRKIVQAAWQGIQTAVSYAWNNVIKPAVSALVGFFQNVIAPAAMWLWRNVFEPVFKGISWAVKAAWVVIQIALKAFQLYLTNVVIPVIRFLYNNVVQPVFQAIGKAISWVWVNLIKPTFSSIRDAFTTVGSVLKGVWDKTIRPMFDSFGGFLKNTVAPAFGKGVEAIKGAWEKIKTAAKEPVAFVVNSVINPFIGGINKIAGAVGVKDRISPIPGFATGGQVGGRISGAPSSTDNRLAPATIPGVGAVKLAGGEFVVNARDTMRALPLLRWVNDGMRGGLGRITSYLGRRPADMPGDGSEGWAFADGGLVGWVKDVWGALSDPVETIKKPFRAMLSKIPGGGMIRDFLTGAANRILDGAVSFIGGTTTGAAGGRVGAAQAFVRAQAGKPYVWASAGPGGYDCSGIVSAVYNVLAGRNPYSHTFSTGSLPGRWFRPGTVGPLMAGWSHPGQSPASASVGHMAGQIGGLPFESTGSAGVRIGGSARRITQFANRGAAIFDNGGTLMPGYNTVFNGLGRPEPLVRADRAGATYNITVNVAPGGHPAETGRQIVSAIQAYERSNGARWRR